MKRIACHTLGIDQGSVQMFSDFEDDGEMWVGTGPREARRAVTFGAPFREAPVVQAVVAMIDIDAGSNHRADLSVGEVTCEGCELVFRTWGDTKVARVRAEWTAMGAVASEDDWDV
ncbi:H-type lectin domain-containing protein [Jannaschia sp. Os4]|uniref:H-type lectin domain-containing protein n=1 Tax=Jannaschia sp. Os4 TaxID=2807617 RepID=UPI0019394A09|nr:H-type lectin domain-containing protein [Jannaschia sp. Os4]MBM2576178.1 H-type lectin domain-containing protein [Jannaschia sp. Os4]